MTNNFEDIAKSLQKTEPTLQLALLFGSYLEGTAGFESDIDIGVLADRQLSYEEIMDISQAIMDEFDRPGHIIDLFDVPQPITANAVEGLLLFGNEKDFLQLYKKHLFEQEGFGKARDRLIQQGLNEWTR